MSIGNDSLFSGCENVVFSIQIYIQFQTKQEVKNYVKKKLQIIREMTFGFETITPKALNVSYRSFSSTSCIGKKKGGRVTCMSTGRLFKYRNLEIMLNCLQDQDFQQRG